MSITVSVDNEVFDDDCHGCGKKTFLSIKGKHGNCHMCSNEILLCIECATRLQESLALDTQDEVL